MKTNSTITKETAIPRVTADTVLDYIRTYGPGELVHTDGLDRDCLCYTIRVCADGTLAGPWRPCDKEVSRHFWLVNGELGTCLPDEGGCSIFHGVGLDLRLMCSLLADDINGWLEWINSLTAHGITRSEFVEKAAPLIATYIPAQAYDKWDGTGNGIKIILAVDEGDDVWQGLDADLDIDAREDGFVYMWFFDEEIRYEDLGWPGYTDDDSKWDGRAFVEWVFDEFINPNNDIFRNACRRIAGHMYDYWAAAVSA